MAIRYAIGLFYENCNIGGVMYIHILMHCVNLYCLFFKFVIFKMNKNEHRMQVLVFVRNNPCLNDYQYSELVKAAIEYNIDIIAIHSGCTIMI